MKPSSLNKKVKIIDSEVANNNESQMEGEIIIKSKPVSKKKSRNMNFALTDTSAM
jgi:hypothetical protein